MSRGPKHYRISEMLDDRQLVEYGEACRCMIGDDHRDGESLSVSDAADIWLSNGMDEDYTFDYSEDELRRAAGID